MKLTPIMLAAFSLLTSQVLLAQKKTYSLKEIWQKTLQHHPTLASGMAIVKQREAGKKLAKQQILPELTLQAQKSFGSYQSVPGAYFPLPGSYNTSGLNGSTGSGFNSGASALLQWDLFQFGRIKSRVEVADAYLKSGQALVDQQAFQLKLEGTGHYFSALHHQALLKLYREETLRLSSLLELTKAQSEAGLLPGADTLLLRSAYLQSRSKVNEQQVLFQESILMLGSLMNVDAATIRIEDSSYFNHQSVFLSDSHHLSQHPLLQYLEAGINLEKAELEEIKKQPYPSVGLLAGAGLRGSGINASGIIDKSLAAPWTNNTGSYLVGIGITWNLSSLLENRTRQQMAGFEMASSQSDYDASLLRLNTLYETAVNGWMHQQQRLKEAKEAFESSQKAYDLYTVRFENGLIDLIELLQLQKSLQDSELNYVNATYAYWNELINQSAALGNPSLITNALQQ